jgi:peptidoglycan/LPS O-acetylase OafA/YrhL
LRAVAVLGVLVYHLNRAWLPGGFLGVDIFFVLSGYLITMLLLAEHRETGRIHLPTFWARRLRRLLPALLVLLVVMVILIDIGGDPLATGQARGDLLSTLFYFANWHFITSGQSYFTQFLAVSPDRHTWSLAIEEQFYLFWPIVVAIVLARFRTRTLAAVAATVAVASALWMVQIFDPADPSRAYYGTDARVFEILIGALLAIGLAGPWRAQLTRSGRRLAPVGLLVLLGAYVLLADDNSFYYHGGAVLISLAAVALIAGLEGGSALDRLLSLRPLVMVGLVSYGLYLWHFPIITFVNERIGPTSGLDLALLATLITLGATTASYFVVERPIRRGGKLIRYKLTPARLARVVPVASGAVAMMIVVATAGGIDNPDWATVATPAPATSAPVLTHSPSATGSLLAIPPAGGSPAATPVGGPGWTVGLVGDSVMVSALPGLQKEADARGWRLVSGAERSCPGRLQAAVQHQRNEARQLRQRPRAPRSGDRRTPGCRHMARPPVGGGTAVGGRSLARAGHGGLEGRSPCRMERGPGPVPGRWYSGRHRTPAPSERASRRLRGCPGGGSLLGDPEAGHGHPGRHKGVLYRPQRPGRRVSDRGRLVVVFVGLPVSHYSRWNSRPLAGRRPDPLHQRWRDLVRSKVVRQSVGCREERNVADRRPERGAVGAN